VTSPAAGAIYILGVAAAAAFECSDQGGLSGLASCTGTVPAGTNFDTSSVGTKTFTVIARDAAGNAISHSLTYMVQYEFTGFLMPVENPPVMNRLKAGNGVPIRFSLNGNHGLSIFESGYPKVHVIACDSFAPLSDVAETVSAGSSSLSYDPVPDQYVYVWKTEKSWGNSCRQLTVKLIDGTVHTAQFQLTK
jgi:hypothetical protein